MEKVIIILTAIIIMLLFVATAFTAQHTPPAADTSNCLINVINRFNITEFKNFGNGCVYIRGNLNDPNFVIRDIHIIWCNRTIVTFITIS